MFGLGYTIGYEHTGHPSGRRRWVVRFGDTVLGDYPSRAMSQRSAFGHHLKRPDQRDGDLAKLYGALVLPLRVGHHGGMNSQLDELRKIAEEWQVELCPSASSTTGYVSLDKLVVPRWNRQRGWGTATMMAVAEYADVGGWKLACTPSTQFGASSVTRLGTFYRRFGFVANRGVDIDLAVAATMRRDPQPVADDATLEEMVAALRVGEVLLRVGAGTAAHYAVQRQGGITCQCSMVVSDRDALAVMHGQPSDAGSVVVAHAKTPPQWPLLRVAGGDQ